ncbi:hypothetical protein BC936DRAFT_139594 [Jimgerdemannia flammicorona]|uniref:PCI domain-containing protein n=1 Tax=Jimgerdemannia flammicorona TaxID=994334 RepID=A0A433DHL1_9FUNG|nr:hypothetical protein BC936DRAFT_139594 [Jimgerdemannia flammicorona]
MADALLASSTHHRLEAFLLLSKSARGVAIVKLITDVLSAPGVYVFAELLEMPNVAEMTPLRLFLLQSVNIPQVEPYIRLLKIFSYGTYKDYKGIVSETRASANPEISRTCRHWSRSNSPSSNTSPLSPSPASRGYCIFTQFLIPPRLIHFNPYSISRFQTIPYELLLSYLDIPNVRELEDLIIDAFYQDVLKGKLDQRKKQLEIEYAMGRDLRPGQIEDMISVLSEWSNTSTTILAAIDAKMASVTDTLAQHKREREDYERELEKVRKEVKQSSKSMDMDGVMDHRGGMGMMGGGPRGMMLDDDRFDSREYSEESSRAGRMAKR